MDRIVFTARGHENIEGMHDTTLEITTESNLTLTGTCIVGVCSSLNLSSLGDRIKVLATSPATCINLRLTAGEIVEEVKGYGSPGLTYSNPVSMVIRKSTYECDRTLMVGADKSASELNRTLIEKLGNRNAIIHCELEYSSGR
jgi:hypothetical protein